MGSVAVVPRFRVTVELSGDAGELRVQQACWRIRTRIVDELVHYGLAGRFRHEASMEWGAPIELSMMVYGDEQAIEDAIRRAVQDGPVRALAVHVKNIDTDGGAG